MGEHKVLLLLRARGWTCLAERWRCRFGELDLVMAKQTGVEGRLLVVEVKSRQRCGLDGWGVAACNAAKLQRLARAMACWQMANQQCDLVHGAGGGRRALAAYPQARSLDPCRRWGQQAWLKEVEAIKTRKGVLACDWRCVIASPSWSE